MLDRVTCDFSKVTKTGVGVEKLLPANSRK
jgi:hypothetical protein